jgi:hypothetical protein
MSITDYLIDSALVLVVLFQLKERTLTTKTLLRPLVILAIAVSNYLHSIPTAGNDLVLIGVLATCGLSIGLASGQTVRMRLGRDGGVLARAGWASAFLWVLGMGSRFGFALWVSHGGGPALLHFSAQHQITGAEAWTVALLAMAVFEVCGRTLVMAARRHQLQQGVPVAELA